MSVKIKILYTTEEELEKITSPLSSLVRNWKKKPAKGKYKRAYGFLKCKNVKEAQKNLENSCDI